MVSKQYEYRGQRVTIELFLKSDRTFAWGFVIGSGDCIGPEGVRASSREHALADAMTAAEKEVDHILSVKRGGVCISIVHNTSSIEQVAQPVVAAAIRPGLLSRGFERQHYATLGSPLRRPNSGIN